MPSKPESPSDQIELVNVGDGRWSFNIHGPAELDGTEPIVGRLILGYAADVDDAPHIREHGRNPYKTPNPRVVVSRAEWDRLGPQNHAVLAHLIASGQVKVRELSR